MKDDLKGGDKFFILHASTEELSAELVKLLDAEPVTLYTRALFAEILRRMKAEPPQPYAPDPLDELVRG